MGQAVTKARRNGSTTAIADVAVDETTIARPRSTWSRRRRLLNACSCRSSEIDLREYVRGVERVIYRAAGAARRSSR